MDVLTWYITADPDRGVCTVAFRGELTDQTIINVRATVLKCMVECPAAIVVDLHGCDVDPQMSLAILSTLQRRARERGARLPYTAGEALAGRIRRDAARWFVELYPTLAQARDAALEAGSHRWLRIELPPHPRASAEARVQVGYLCTAWGAGHVAHHARVIVSELVDNAVEHAGTRIEVTVTALRDLLRIGVRDHSHQRPVRPAPRAGTPAAPQAVRGQGLRLIEQHATAWGVTPTEDGKIVWATLHKRPIQSKDSARSKATIRYIGRKRPGQSTDAEPKKKALDAQSKATWPGRNAMGRA